MYSDLKGKTALVTGSGKKTGIGYAIAKSLAASGADVIIADLGQDPSENDTVQTGTLGEMESIAREIEEEFSVSALAVEVDVTDNDAIGRMIEKIRESFEHIDVLCNNAGASFGVPNAVHTYDESAWMKTIDVNLH
ncbi:MAG: SDR family NAD(P)-dependent oxidoreductase, partial [Desulfobacteraceae bacterium]|nr:SDR family NAD(P)-dependent oxidoreductase [Desulfobacteraceae bacterium]